MRISLRRPLRIRIICARLQYTARRNLRLTCNIRTVQKNKFKGCYDLGMGYLISETTKEEREKIVAESLGNINGSCDGCMAGLAEMYQDYIDGKKEIQEINMAFRAQYESGDEGPVKKRCSYI